MEQLVQVHSLLTEYDVSLYQGGNHYQIHKKLGAHRISLNGEDGIQFSVYAPAAKAVHVIGDFNAWQSGHALHVRWDGSGIWEGFIPNISEGTCYKFRIHSHHGFQIIEKADPYARYSELPPKTASKIWNQTFKWSDGRWMRSRKNKNKIGAPLSVYEVHLDSWRKNEQGERYTYRELAKHLTDYVSEMGFTHVEFMPIMEYPYDPSWGYQITGYFAPTSRFGTPEDLKYLINALHKENIGVILDWVPSHFPSDGHGLGNFDGSHVYEHPDPRKGYHPDWESLIFNYGRHEVQSFLISNAMYWLEEFHIDGLRVDAVASMIYLDYSRDEGGWEPNQYGGRENLEAIDFLKSFNEAVYGEFPDIITIAEESTAFAGVSRPTYNGGLGFGMKWMMGWMHDTLNYFQIDPLFRKYHHNSITFSMIYAYSENYMLPLSHDEVVHGKGSLLTRMPGFGEDEFANLRVLYTYMFTHPGAKLLFMGGEFGQRSEWNFRSALDWHLLEHQSHKGIQHLVKTLNQLYKSEKALFERCTEPAGFEWVNHDDWQNSVMAYLRKGKKKDDQLLIILNFTPVDRIKYRVGVPMSKSWKRIFSSEEKAFWGKDDISIKTVSVQKKASHQYEKSVVLALPKLSGLVYKLSK